MSLTLDLPGNTVMKPKITVIGVGGAGGNATNNMIAQNLEGTEFVVANTDAQALADSLAERRIQLGSETTQGLGAGADPSVGAAAAEEVTDQIKEHIEGSNMVFIAAGMGGGTGTGAAPVIAKIAREQGILTVGVVTKPFHFEGPRRMRMAEAGLEELQKYVDTLIIIPNQNLFRVANEQTTFADAFKMADDVLQSGVRGITDLMVMPGLINLDFADVRAVMSEMGKAMMGTGEAEGQERAQQAAEAAISNPLLDNVSMKGAKGVLINITGGPDMTLFEVDEAANRIREEVEEDANIIFGSTFNEALQGKIRVSVVATGIGLTERRFQPEPVSAPTQVARQAASPEPVNDDLQDEVTSQQAEADAPLFVSREAEGVTEFGTAAEAETTERPAAETIENSSQIRKEAQAKQEREQEYLKAIESLNAEYQAFKEEVPEADSPQEDTPTSFVAEPPAKPKAYEDDLFSTANQKQAAPVEEEVKKQPSGLFGRVVQAAKKVTGTEHVEENKTQEEVTISSSSSAVSGTTTESEDDMMDIPAFLRRKNN